MAKNGAWNKENINDISHNVSKLEQSLNLGSGVLTQNDFSRVNGLNFHGRSLQTSIHFLNKSSLISVNAKNPFQNFPLYSTTFSNWENLKRRERDIPIKINRKLPHTEG